MLGASTGSTGSSDQSRNDLPVPMDTEQLPSPKKMEDLPSPSHKKSLFKKGNEDGRDKYVYHTLNSLSSSGVKKVYCIIFFII